jgi:hypothetical protein
MRRADGGTDAAGRSRAVVSELHASYSACGRFAGAEDGNKPVAPDQAVCAPVGSRPGATPKTDPATEPGHRRQADRRFGAGCFRRDDPAWWVACNFRGRVKAARHGWPSFKAIMSPRFSAPTSSPRCTRRTLRSRRTRSEYARGLACSAGPDDSRRGSIGSLAGVVPRVVGEDPIALDGYGVRSSESDEALKPLTINQTPTKSSHTPPGSVCSKFRFKPMISSTEPHRITV